MSRTDCWQPSPTTRTACVPSVLNRSLSVWTHCLTLATAQGHMSMSLRSWGDAIRVTGYSARKTVWGRVKMFLLGCRLFTSHPSGKRDPNAVLCRVVAV